MQSIETHHSNLHNRRILVIDDNPAIHEDFRKIFASGKSNAELDDAEFAFFGEAIEVAEIDLNIEIDSAPQGEVGLHKVIDAMDSGRPYAMAFVDMRMPPGWDGLTTIEQLWKVAPDLQVVICSAYSDNSWADICKRLGKSDRLLILKKPFDNSEVCQLALALTEKWNLAKQAKLKREELEILVDERTLALKEKDIALRQKHKLEAVGSLAGGIAHEFNNLLQAIRGYACFAREALPVDEQPYEDLGHVVDASDRAAGIVGQLLSFSRRTPAQKSRLKVTTIVEMTLAMFKPFLPADVELEFENNNPTAMVFADADVLSQSLLNLCINARDAMPSGGQLRIVLDHQTIGARAGYAGSINDPLLEPGNYVVLSVSDTGCGMSDEVKDRIFEPFYTTKEVGKGTGMGLAIVFSALQDHSGAVTVESILGVGSTFSIYLPIVLKVANAAPTVNASLEKHLLTGNETILLAEDDAMVRCVAARLLRQAGYDVIEAADGQDAINQVQDHLSSIQLAILDLVMPKFNGHEVAEKLRIMRPETKVTFCTAYGQELELDDATIYPTPVIIAKPIVPEAFLTIVREVLDEVVRC